ncbi:MAG: histidinol dehydrogenase, partial [Bacteroidaceae bacterium]|nr:histidinol dehydrogenase [Bacteroidaceae bacterium]
MNILRYPDEATLAEALKRPARDAAELNELVRGVLEDVRQHGDEAIRMYEERFDHVTLTDLAVGEEEWTEAEQLVAEDLKAAMQLAHDNIYRFHVA